MLAYPKSIILNGLLVKKVKSWYAQQLLSTEQYVTITNSLKTETFTPTTFIKIGLFIFTGILFSAVIGLFSLFFGSMLFDNQLGGTIVCALFGGGSFWVLEYMIKEKKHFNSGVDDALLYIGCALLLYALYNLVNLVAGDSPLFFCVVAMPLLIFLVKHYADKVMVFCVCSVLFYIIGLLIYKFGDAQMKLVPLALMLATGVLYVGIKKYQNTELWVLYTACLQFAESYCLLLFYAVCNYYVVSELASSIFGVYLLQYNSTWLAIVFYVLTGLIPLVYIGYALYKKDKLLLWMGLLITAFAAFTFKKYFSMGHPEILFTLLGMLLIGIAYLAINYFKTGKHGITYIEDLNEDHFMKSNAEALIIAQSFSNQTASDVSSSETTDFGGGQGGGAGSGGEF